MSDNESIPFTTFGVGPDKNVEEFKKLISEGAVNAVDENGVSALMVATQFGYIDVVKELMAKRADVNARDVLGRTALMYAARAGRLDIVGELLLGGADAGAKDKEGNIALAYASGAQREAIVTKLVYKDTLATVSCLARREEQRKQQSGCFIASAVYSHDSAEVRVLQVFRDVVLSQTPFGRAFIGMYYGISPSLAKYILRYPITKVLLKPILRLCVLIAGSRLYRQGRETRNE